MNSGNLYFFTNLSLHIVGLSVGDFAVSRSKFYSVSMLFLNLLVGGSYCFDREVLSEV